MHSSHAVSLPAAVQANRFGIMGCCFMKLDFREHCRRSAEIGVSYVETFANLLKPDVISATEARACLEAGKLELLLMIAPNLDLDQPETYLENLEERIEFWKEVGLRSFVVLRAGRIEGRFDEFVRLLSRAGKRVREHGLMPLTQNHRGGMVESPEELVASMASGVGMLFDTQQFQIVGNQPLQVWEQLGQDVLHVHLADRFADGSSAEFGQGVIGLDRLLQRMHNSGYRGAITLEPELADLAGEAQPYVQAAYDYVRAVMAPLGALGTSVPAISSSPHIQGTP